MDDWLTPLLRLLHYAALLGLFGAAAFAALRLRGVVTGPGRGLLAAAWAAPLISIALFLAAVAAMMGQRLAALEWASVEAFLFSTSIGYAFVLRIAALIAGLVLLLRARRSGGSPGPAALAYGLALATLPWTGHAAASEGTAGLVHRAGTIVHLLAAGLWIGGIGWLLALVAQRRRNPERIAAGTVRAAVRGFAPLGVACVALVVLTGAVSAEMIFGLDQLRAVLGSAYGQLLAAKLALVALMLVCAAINRRLGQRWPEDGAPAEDTVLPRLRASLTAELALALGAIALVAVLGMLMPGE